MQQRSYISVNWNLHIFSNNLHFILNSIGVTLVCDKNKLVFTYKIFLSTLSTFEHTQEFLQDQIKNPTWSDNLYLIILDIFLEVNCHLSVTREGIELTANSSIVTKIIYFSQLASL